MNRRSFTHILLAAALNPRTPNRNGLGREVLWWFLGGLALTVAFDGVLSILVLSLYRQGVLSKSDAGLVATVGLIVGTLLGAIVMLFGAGRYMRRAKARRENSEPR